MRIYRKARLNRDPLQARNKEILFNFNLPDEFLQSGRLGKYSLNMKFLIEPAPVFCVQHNPLRVFHPSRFRQLLIEIGQPFFAKFFASFLSALFANGSSFNRQSLIDT